MSPVITAFVVVAVLLVVAVAVLVCVVIYKKYYSKRNIHEQKTNSNVNGVNHDNYELPENVYQNIDDLNSIPYELNERNSYLEVISSNRDEQVDEDNYNIPYQINYKNEISHTPVDKPVLGNGQIMMVMISSHLIVFAVYVHRIISAQCSVYLRLTLLVTPRGRVPQFWKIYITSYFRIASQNIQTDTEWKCAGSATSRTKIILIENGSTFGVTLLQAIVQLLQCWTWFSDGSCRKLVTFRKFLFVFNQNEKSQYTNS
ncbi:hypothetical protein Btru_037360 [Bulinus truncatus]|nr:hypothetical protein Btru_037360 [Bulinus truncatus]